MDGVYNQTSTTLCPPAYVLAHESLRPRSRNEAAGEAFAWRRVRKSARKQPSHQLWRRGQLGKTLAAGIFFKVKLSLLIFGTSQL